MKRFQLKIKGFQLKIKGFQWKIKGLQLKIKGFQVKIKGFQVKIKGFQWKIKGFQLKIKGFQLKLLRFATFLSRSATFSHTIQQALHKTATFCCVSFTLCYVFAYNSTSSSWNRYVLLRFFHVVLRFRIQFNKRFVKPLRFAAFLSRCVTFCLVKLQFRLKSATFCCVRTNNMLNRTALINKSYGSFLQTSTCFLSWTMKTTTVTIVPIRFTL